MEWNEWKSIWLPRNWNVCCYSFCVYMSTEIKENTKKNSTQRNFYCREMCERIWNIDQIEKKLIVQNNKVQYLIDESYRLYSYNNVIENLQYLFENLFSMTPSSDEMYLRVVMCDAIPMTWLNLLGPFQALRNHKIFLELNLPKLSDAIKMRQKSQKDFSLSNIN